jgi:aminopeptidase N
MTRHRSGSDLRTQAFAAVILCMCLLTASTGHSLAQRTASPIIASEAFPAYEMDLALDPKKRTLGGFLSVEWENTTGEAQEQIYFRTYPNAEYYAEAETLVEDVEIDGSAAESAFLDDPTVLQVTPAEPVDPGDAVTIAMQFTTLVPADTKSGFGVFQYLSETGVWDLANWYPILAGYEPGIGWYLQEPTTFGDPTFSETSTYDVSLELPADLTLVSTGETTETRPGDASMQHLTIETGPAREFAMTLLPDDVDTAEAGAGDVTVRVTLSADATAPGIAQFMADTASQVLTVYESWMGEYPGTEFDISVASLSGANGVSWSGLTWFSLAPLVADGALSEEEKVGLAFVILHEVGHQWIADVVGSNNNDHGFMTEGLVNALAVLAAEEIYGIERADQYLRAWVSGPYSSLLNDGRDGIADAPLMNETNGVIRSLLIYGKAAVGFIAIREEIGAGAFLVALDDYAETWRFAVSEPGDLLAAFEEASGEELDELWSFWFNQANATTNDLNEILNAFAA